MTILYPAINSMTCKPQNLLNLSVDAPKIVVSTLGDNHPVRTLVQLLFRLEWWLQLGIMGPVSQKWINGMNDWLTKLMIGE